MDSSRAVGIVEELARAKTGRSEPEASQLCMLGDKTTVLESLGTELIRRSGYAPVAAGGDVASTASTGTTFTLRMPLSAGKGPGDGAGGSGSANRD